MRQHAKFRKAMRPYVLVRAKDPEGPGMPPVFHRFGIKLIPTVVILDADGTEVDRITGYSGWRAMARKLVEIRNGTGTIRPDRTGRGSPGR